MLKRIYHLLAWLAMINLFAVAGLLAYLFGSGRLNAERMDQVAMVLRGEFPKPEAAATQPARTDAVPQTSRDQMAALEARKRFFTLISERHQRELEDRRALNQSIQMDVMRQLEQIETRRQEFQQEKKKVEDEMAETGFQQVLDMYASMEPKLAKDILITKKDADVVRLFMKMDAGRRTKIVNTCKTEQEKQWVSRVMARMREQDITAGGQAPAAGVAGGK